MAENISIQRSNCNILGLRDSLDLSANEARFFRFRVFWGAYSLQNEVGDPRFLASLAIVYRCLSAWQVLKKLACVAWRFKLYFSSASEAAKPRKRAVKLSLSQAPRDFGVCYRGFPA